ncbi:Storkhead-box protein 2, partial [Dissostichus eleginoides]
MKKTSSCTLKRAWPSSEVSAEPLRGRSHSERDYRTHKQSKRNPYPPQYLCRSPPAYRHT